MGLTKGCVRQSLYRLSCVVLAGLLSACSSTAHTRRGDPQFAAVRPAVKPISMPSQKINGAIYQTDNHVRWFEDVKARQVGDMVTILLQEKTAASKSSDSSINKSSSVEIGAPTVFGKQINNLSATIPGGTRTFDGQGSANQDNSLVGTIAATVSEVLPNGTLVVQGEKWISINQGEEYIQMSGMVRPVDISYDNTVLSTQVADAKILYGGEGTIASSSAVGWLSKFFFSSLWPF